MASEPDALAEPTFDADGYPTDETLEAVRKWPLAGWPDYEAAMDFVGRAWSYPDYWQKERGWADPDDARRPCVRYVFSTGGWSGNESLVGAVMDNPLLQMLGAWSWRRGGHYEYRFPMDPE